jgi:hypothetical protein
MRLAAHSSAPSVCVTQRQPQQRWRQHSGSRRHRVAHTHAPHDATGRRTRTSTGCPSGPMTMRRPSWPRIMATCCCCCCCCCINCARRAASSCSSSGVRFGAVFAAPCSGAEAAGTSRVHRFAGRGAIEGPVRAGLCADSCIGTDVFAAAQITGVAAVVNLVCKEAHWLACWVRVVSMRQ